MAKTRLRISKHFTIEEFDCHDGTRVPEHAIVGLRHWTQWWGEPMRELFGPIKVVSGYRTTGHNRAVGGAPKSVHLYRTEMSHAPSTSSTIAIAADVVPAHGDVTAWARWAVAHRKANDHLLRQGRGGIGEYHAQRFMHLDTWTARGWAG